MNVFFQCVAEAVAEKGIRIFAEMVPGGGAMFDVAKLTWEKYQHRCNEAQQREQIKILVDASFDVKQAASEAANKAASKQPELVPLLELFLTQIPGSIRQSQKRSDDPPGTTIPAKFPLRGPDDVAKLLPPDRDVKFNIGPSKFHEPCEEAIRREAKVLDAGGVVKVKLKPGGFNGAVVVTIRSKDLSKDWVFFGADWSATDLTFFPARIKAAATALRNCERFGRFEIKHKDGLLEIRSV